MAQQQQQHPIFRDIEYGDLEAVKQRVLADPAVLEERGMYWQPTLLIYAIFHCKLAIALWLIKHRGRSIWRREIAMAALPCAWPARAPIRVGAHWTLYRRWCRQGLTPPPPLRISGRRL